jgi:hypothetical protein
MVSELVGGGGGDAPSVRHAHSDRNGKVFKWELRTQSFER